MEFWRQIKGSLRVWGRRLGTQFSPRHRRRPGAQMQRRVPPPESRDQRNSQGVEQREKADFPRTVTVYLSGDRLC